MGKSTATARDGRPIDIPDRDSEIVRETPFEAIASICSVLVVGLFILTFLGRNFVIPSGSMENTLLVGDHLLVDRLTLSPPTTWIPLVHYREPKRGDIVVFIKPVANSAGEYLYLVKRLIGVPGDRIHLHDGIVFVNGAPQTSPPEGKDSPSPDPAFLDEFPSVAPTASGPDGTPEAWAVDFHNHIQDGDLVVPPGQYFMMGDHRHGSLDSRYWGFVPRENVVGRAILNYWSFTTPDEQYKKNGLGNSIAWIGHVALHFFTDTRWNRTLKFIK
jgi:signal peptidase I